MSKAGRKRTIGIVRTPGGRPSRAGGEAPPSRAQILRVVSSDPRYGTLAGLACLAREITEAEYDMAKTVAATVADYHRALQIAGIASPAAEEGRAGMKSDPDTEAGQAEAKRHQRAIARYDRMREALLLRGKSIFDATVDFCTDIPCDWQRRTWAKVGLTQLVEAARGKNVARGG